MTTKRQAVRVLALLAAPACVIVPTTAVGVPGAALIGVVLSVVVGLHVAKEILATLEPQGFRRSLLHFGLGVGCGCVSLGLAFLGCTVCGVEP